MSHAVADISRRGRGPVGDSRRLCPQRMAVGLRENFHCTYFAEDCSMYASEYSSDLVSDDDDFCSRSRLQPTGPPLPHTGFKPPETVHVLTW